MVILNRFGVVGFLTASDQKMAAIYLASKNVVNFRQSEAKGLIWMSTVGESLDRQFSGLRSRTQRQLPAPSKLWNGGLTDKA